MRKSGYLYLAHSGYYYIAPTRKVSAEIYYVKYAEWKQGCWAWTWCVWGRRRGQRLVRPCSLSLDFMGEVICKLAEDLRLDADILLAMAGKVSSELQEVIRNRPELFGLEW